MPAQQQPAIIVVDIGNTSTSFALARQGAIAHVDRLPTQGTSRLAIRRRLAAMVRAHPIRGAALCSVVPEQNCAWTRELRRLTGRPPLLVQHRLKLGIGIKYPRPGTIGADRLANACAAAELYGPPIIVADFGTALTFDIVARDLSYIGGIIAPGLPLMTEYLADRTALLPRVQLEHRGARHPGLQKMPVIGKSTVEAIRIGARLGYVGMVREIFRRLRSSLQEPGLRLCATGGYAAWVLAGSGLRVRIDPNLTLKGISRIYHLNQPGEDSEYK